MIHYCLRPVYISFSGVHGAFGPLSQACRLAQRRLLGKERSGLRPHHVNTAVTTQEHVLAVPMDDADLATHAKAGKLFLDSWEGVNVIVMDGTADAATEATAYEAKMKALPPSVLPRDASGVPQFDMMLIGVGDDGHVPTAARIEPSALVLVWLLLMLAHSSRSLFSITLPR